MPRGDEPLGDIATTVLFENDKVKIWNLVVDPGQASQWHIHERDYVTIVVGGGGLDIEFDDGTSGHNESEVGTWRFHGEHKVHRVVNNSNQQYKNVLVELKR